MVRPRIPETDEGITGEFNVVIYDELMRRLRDKRWMETNSIIEQEITSGLALEVGPGPGYLGLEWLKNTDNTTLKALEISEDMIVIAKRNAKEYDLTDRIEYVQGDAHKMPFEDSCFDAVFSNWSLHEWARPKEVLNEVSRVLKAGGKFYISDLRRDMNPLMKWFMWFATKPKDIRPGFISSINAAYTVGELNTLLGKTKLQGWHVKKSIPGLLIVGQTPLND